MLATNRGLLKTILLSIITFGIYPICVMSAISRDINIVATKYDNKKTMHYCLLIFVVIPLTCGIASLVWYNNISARIGAELRRRKISYSFGASDYWLWNVLGTLLFGIGPLVYLHKLFKATNLMCEDFNKNG